MLKDLVRKEFIFHSKLFYLILNIPYNKLKKIIFLIIFLKLKYYNNTNKLKILLKNKYKTSLYKMIKT